MMHSPSQLDGCTVRLEFGGPDVNATFEELNPIIKAVQYGRNDVIRWLFSKARRQRPLRICSTLSERFGSRFAAWHRPVADRERGQGDESDAGKPGVSMSSPIAATSAANRSWHAKKLASRSRCTVTPPQRMTSSSKAEGRFGKQDFSVHAPARRFTRPGPNSNVSQKTMAASGVPVRLPQAIETEPPG
jgi:hypothetical protein